MYQKTDKTLLSPLADDEPKGAKTRRVLGMIGLLFGAWLGVNAVWGLTSSSDTLISELQRALAPLGWWVALAVVILGGVVLLAAWRRDRSLLVATFMLMAYLLGVLGSRYAKVMIEPSGALLHRSFVALAAIPMLIVVWAARSRREGYPLRFGDWSIQMRLFSSGKKKVSWGGRMLPAIVFVALPSAALLQASVGFAPILEGTLWPALPLILSLALLNGFVEELLFRGLIQPALVGYLGPGRGIWLQSIFFGIHHWGASPSAIAGLPMAIILVFLGVVFGKSVHETRGLGWAICLHAALDIGTLSVTIV